MFLRKLGSRALCQGGHNCPDVLELESGDWAVIGVDITAEAMGKFPEGSGCGPGERVVRIPRQILIDVRTDIPAAI